MINENNPAKSNRFERHPFFTLLLFLVVLLILSEATLRLLSATDIIKIKYYTTETRVDFYTNNNRYFGDWHMPGSAYRHQDSCFDITYHANSYGARDKERTLDSDARRVVVLGDSQVEGFGVEEDDRMTNVLERMTGIEHLNFGRTRFGSIQEWLLYKNLASKFSHDDIYIFWVNNDFFENNPKFWPKNRYRPYLDENRNVIYPVPFEKRQMGQSESMVYINELFNHVYLFNLIRQLRTQLIYKTAKSHDYIRKFYYNEFTEDDIETLLYTYKQIIQEAGKERNIYIFTFPFGKAFDHSAALGRYDESLKLPNILSDFASKYENVRYYDLLRYFVDYKNKSGVEYSDFKLKCDGHYSVLGNKVAAEGVYHFVYGEK